MHGMVAAGADVIELGVPFSDPMADGPVIQKAGERRIGARHRHDAGAGDGARLPPDRHRTPVVLMGYANPVERYDSARQGRFIRDAAAAGVDGLLIVDYPPEECEDFADSCVRRTST
jgi:tryptophan synthase alpha chain